MIKNKKFKNKRLIPVNEGMFGFETFDKPNTQLNGDYIVEASVEEIAAVLPEYSLYLISKNGGNINVAVENLIQYHNKINLVNEDTDKGVLLKYFNAYTLSVKNGIMGKYKSLKDDKVNLGNHILFSVAYLVHYGMATNGPVIKALADMYNMLNAYLNEGFNAISSNFDKADNINSFIKKAEDNIKMFLVINMVIADLVATNMTGASQAFSQYFKKISDSVKKESLFAVFVVRTLFANKNQIINELVSKTFDSVKKECVEIWNKLDKETLQQWKGVCERYLNWVNTIKFVEISKEDNGRVFAAGKEVNKEGSQLLKNPEEIQNVLKDTVKKLNKEKYPLDKVIDVVKQAYNESVYVIGGGKKMLNEGKFHKAINESLSEDVNESTLYYIKERLLEIYPDMEIIDNPDNGEIFCYSDEINDYDVELDEPYVGIAVNLAGSIIATFYYQLVGKEYTINNVVKDTDPDMFIQKFTDFLENKMV